MDNLFTKTFKNKGKYAFKKLSKHFHLYSRTTEVLDGKPVSENDTRTTGRFEGNSGQNIEGDNGRSAQGKPGDILSELPESEEIDTPPQRQAGDARNRRKLCAHPRESSRRGNWRSGIP